MSEVQAFVKPHFKQPIFLCRLEPNFIEISSQNVIFNLKEQALIMFNCKVVAIVEDCVDGVIDDPDLKNYHIISLSKFIDQVSENCLDCTLELRIKNILQAFSIPIIEKEKKWDAYLNLFETFLKNIPNMRQIIGSESIEVSENIAAELFNSSLNSNISRCIFKLNFFRLLSEPNECLSDKICCWLNLYTQTALITQESLIEKQIFSKLNLSSYVLNPKYKENNLCPSMKSSVRFYVSKELQDHEEFEKFDQYLESVGEFAEEELINKDSKMYWAILKGYCPKLSSLALKLAALPADTNFCSVKINQETVSEETLKMLEFIKSTL